MMEPLKIFEKTDWGYKTFIGFKQIGAGVAVDVQGMHPEAAKVKTVCACDRTFYAAHKLMPKDCPYCEPKRIAEEAKEKARKEKEAADKKKKEKQSKADKAKAGNK